MNARTKSHAAELAAKQARADSEYARVRAHEVAPDFVQPGEQKKVPEIILDIDRMNTYAPQLGLPDPMTFGGTSLSPNQFRKPNMDPLRSNSSPMDFMGWQQQQNFNAPHSNTPPPQMLRPPNNQLTPTRQANQFYDQQQRQFHQQQQLEFPNHISSNQIVKQQQQQLHPSIDPNSKLNIAVLISF